MNYVFRLWFIINQKCLDRLHFFISILTIFINVLSSLPHFLMGYQLAYKEFSSMMLLVAYVGYPNNLKLISLNYLLCYPQTLLKVLIFYFIFFSFTKNPSQHSYLSSTHFVHVLFPAWPTFCSIDHSWSNNYPIKNFSSILVGSSNYNSYLGASFHFNHLTLILWSKSSSISQSLLIIKPMYQNKSLYGIS